MQELIRIGAYRKGSDVRVDEAIKLYPFIEEFMTQDKNDQTSIEDSFKRLAKIIGLPYGFFSVIASAAKQSRAASCGSGLLRCARNDEEKNGGVHG